MSRVGTCGNGGLDASDCVMFPDSSMQLSLVVDWLLFLLVINKDQICAMQME